MAGRTPAGTPAGLVLALILGAAGCAPQDVAIDAPAAADAPAEPLPGPAETDPAETDPAETDPVETAPAETAPAETAPAATRALPDTLVDLAVYGPRQDGARSIAAVDVEAFHPALLRNRVPYAAAEAPGTIVIDTEGPFLYLVEPEGMATRYGIAIGREGFGWTGTGVVARTARWPGWTPPPEMIEREPHLAKWTGGMPGGPDNPLGARALYIYFGGADSGYRIHGTNQPKSIGWAASSGCFRMLNQDVIDLYDRVALGAKVIVR